MATKCRSVAGFASYSTGDDLREILQIADKQMYQNKYAEKIAS